MEEITLTMDKHEIVSQPTIKFLGITTDARLSFKNHLKIDSDKAAKIAAALSRLMPNVGGLTQKQRLLLAKEVQESNYKNVKRFKDRFSKQMSRYEDIIEENEKMSDNSSESEDEDTDTKIH
ncbi:hypothetical protein TSAR_011095 [Trichomalopsis sarcophagae]|uniref:Uncharacterized protein n=1 Tax=Trichomalopsis sarcophagae TaxID=543379 RepID=A0A232EKX1_9HYME|nr:hypothetical protein TSAR_011095 [Trichomalopsis sarcophagae]